MSRYSVKPTPPNGHTFGIWDHALRDFCGLPRERNGPGWWLEWGSAERAQEWLDLCCATWREWPPQFAPVGYGRPAPTPATPKPAAPRKRATPTRRKGPRSSS
jgi:hypothetical protein